MQLELALRPRRVFWGATIETRDVREQFCARRCLQRHRGFGSDVRRFQGGWNWAKAARAALGRFRAERRFAPALRSSSSGRTNLRAKEAGHV